MALAPMPGRGGHYADDLAQILAWQPGLVISMVETAELFGPLGADLQGAGVDWCQVPVVDYGVPEPAHLWDVTAQKSHAVLAQGGKVLVHCMGGCGRSGMAVLQHMITLGERPDEALERLRSHRPCAVETKAQLAWAQL
jgi:protein-tyrosine phosphatase